MWKTSADASEEGSFSCRQRMLDEQVSVLEEIGDLVLEAFVLACRLLCSPAGGTPA